MSQNSYFQVGLDVMGRPCLVIGGGREAEDKTGRLLDAGAQVTLVSPQLTPQLHEWTREERFTYHPRRFEPVDLHGAFVVLNTVGGDDALIQQVYDLACQQGCLINSFDNPAFSNFGMVALIHPGHLRLSISTSNASPALAGRLRQNLEQLFDAEFVDFLDSLALVRHRVKERISDFPTRAALLRALVRDFRLEGQLHYPADWRFHMQALLACDLDHCHTENRCPDCPLNAEGPTA